MRKGCSRLRKLINILKSQQFSNNQKAPEMTRVAPLPYSTPTEAAALRRYGACLVQGL